jgi:hypothetical protein
MEKEGAIPEILYKYRSWSNPHHKRILIENEIYLPSPKEFNDPFDCRIAVDYTLLDTPEKRRQFVDKVIIQNYDELQRGNKDVEAAMMILEVRLLEEIDKIQDMSAKFDSDGFDRHLGVFTAGKKWDSILMWSHYAENHTGFCVGFWSNKLANPNIFGSHGFVKYSKDDTYPSISPLEHTISKITKQTFYKSKDWEYESEYRLTKLLFPMPLTRDLRKITVADDFFAEIIIGLAISDAHKSEIVSIAQSKKIEVYQIKKIPYSFKLEREKIV